MYDEVEEDRPPGIGRGAELLRRAGLAHVPQRAVAGVAALVLIALAVAGWRLGAASSAGPEPGLVIESAAVGEDAATARADGAGDAVDTDQEPATVWVHVAGAVGAPGLIELSADARAGDAIDAAGGPLPDAALHMVNLARPLVDGEQVYVPTHTEIEGGTLPQQTPPGVGSAAPGSSAEGVDINAAGEAELVTLPGVGPATAAKIVADREANGPFSTPEEIMRVAGIGEKKFEAMRDLIIVR